MDLFISSGASICSVMVFFPLENSDVVVSLSIDFPSNLQQDPLLHQITYGCSRADWDGLHDHVKDAPWEDIFKLGASATASEFCELVQIKTLMYISLMESIRSSLTHLHGFQLLVLLL